MNLLRPRAFLESVQQITPEFLTARGLRGLLLDLDNTLVPYGSREDLHGAARWAQQLAGQGFSLYLLSNATHERARFWGEQLSLPGVGLAGKPLPRQYRAGLRMLGLPPGEVAMVGDQLFTDVLGGNLAGLYTIMVRPLSDNALPHTRLARRLERLALGRMSPQPAPVPASPAPPPAPDTPPAHAATPDRRNT